MLLYKNTSCRNNEEKKVYPVFSINRGKESKLNDTDIRSHKHLCTLLIYFNNIFIMLSHGVSDIMLWVTFQKCYTYFLTYEVVVFLKSYSE